MDNLFCLIFALVMVKCQGSCSFSLSPVDAEFNSDAKLFQIELDFSSAQILKPNHSVQNEIFKPTKWYLVQGERANRILLLEYFYYGYFEPHILVSKQYVKVKVNPSSDSCMVNISTENSMNLIRSELLNISKSLKEGSHEVCSMYIREYVGFGILGYKCCKFIENDIRCEDVENDAWIWTLQVTVWCFSIFLFLYFPKFIPVTYRPKTFHFIPKTESEFSILKTLQPSKYMTKLKVSNFIVNQMKELNSVIQSKIQENAVYLSKIKSVKVLVQRNQLLSETDQAVSFFRLLYDLFIRFKIRHVDCLHDFCFSSVCGSKFVAGNIAPWYKLLMRIRTLFIYSTIILPAIPLFYVFTGNNMQSNELTIAFQTRGLLQPESFNPGVIIGTVIVGVLCSLYVLHIIMVLSIDSFQNELMDILDIQGNEEPAKEVHFGTGRVSKIVLKYLSRYGIFSIPAFIILLIISPVLVVMYLIIAAPVFRIFLKQFKRLCSFDSVSSNLTGPTCGPKWSMLLFLSLLSVFVILTIGINFLIQCVCIILVNILINWYFSMSLVSITVLIFVYIRDSAKRLEGKYNSFFKTIFKEIMTLKDEDIRTEAKKSLHEQKATVFDVKQSEIEGMDIATNATEKEFRMKHEWDIKHGQIRFRTSGVVLFLDVHDVPFIPMKFFENMTYVDCPGCPGPLITSLIKSLKNLLMVGVFLLFLFLLVMSYGETVSVTPSTRFFATLVTGLIPLLLRSFFFSKANEASLDTSTLRFRNQFIQNVVSFEKRWPLEDCEISLKDEPFAFSLWKATDYKTLKQEIDLLMDMSGEFKSNNNLCCVSTKIRNLC